MRKRFGMEESMERYYQKEIETADREQILAWQNERLVKQVRHVWDNVPYYRKKMEEKGVSTLVSVNLVDSEVDKWSQEEKEKKEA